jgi:hypothetical protein
MLSVILLMREVLVLYQLMGTCCGFVEMENGYLLISSHPQALLSHSLGIPVNTSKTLLVTTATSHHRMGHTGLE